MAIPKKILNYLEKNNIEVKVIGHKKVYTAHDLAATLDKKMDKIGKSLLVKADGKTYLVLVPGHYALDLSKVKKELKAKKVELANEKHIKKILDMKPGALHPFTGISRVELLLDKALVKTQKAIIRAGSFTESLEMKVKDLSKLENATLGEFGKEIKKQVKKVAKKTKSVAKKAVKHSLKKGYLKKVAKKAGVKVKVKKIKKNTNKVNTKKLVKKVDKKVMPKKKTVKIKKTNSKAPAILRKR